MKWKLARNGNDARALKRAVVTWERNKEEVTNYGKTIARILRGTNGGEGGRDRRREPGRICE